jgi:hypothetical protein
MSNEPSQPPSTTDPLGFSKVLSYHGHPFQYRTLKAAADAYSSKRSRWRFRVAEFPVAVRGRPTRIDYVLQLQEQPTYLVVECKRADPKLKLWAFAKAPYVKFGDEGERFIRQCLKLPGGSEWGGPQPFTEETPITDAYYIAREMKAPHEKGDDAPSGGREAIEDAASQASLALNGLVDLFATKAQATGRNAVFKFVPLIVTTAQLFTADVDFAEASLESGKITAADVQNWTEREWLFYQYPVSPGIQHSAVKPLYNAHEMDLAKVLTADYLRTIVVVQGKHFAEFLSDAATRVIT